MHETAKIILEPPVWNGDSLQSVVIHLIGFTVWRHWLCSQSWAGGFADHSAEHYVQGRFTCFALRFYANFNKCVQSLREIMVAGGEVVGKNRIFGGYYSSLLLLQGPEQFWNLRRSLCSRDFFRLKTQSRGCSATSYVFRCTYPDSTLPRDAFYFPRLCRQILWLLVYTNWIP